MPISATFVHEFFHSHHVYTREMLVLSATNAALGLGTHPYVLPINRRHALNLTAAGLTVDDALAHVQQRLAALQARCTRNGGCEPVPKVRCQLNLDRWEQLPGGEWQERYHAPHCASWTFRKGEVVSIVAFHQLVRPLARRVTVWQHAAFYGYYVSSDYGTSPIPHSMIPMHPEPFRRYYGDGADKVPWD